MATYEKDEGDIRLRVDKITHDYEATYSHLLRRGVRMDLLFAYAPRNRKGVITGPAIKVHGVRALAQVKVLGLKDRTKGCGDVEILVDADWWSDADRKEEERLAVIDHELCHIIVTDDDDKAGRPKIWLRDHDWQFGWFTLIAARWGNASQEVQQAAEILLKAGEHYYPGIMTRNDDDLQLQMRRAGRIAKLETEPPVAA